MTRHIRPTHLLATLAAVLLLVSPGCGTDHAFDRGIRNPAAPGLPAGVSFSANVKPALTVCVSCHGGGAGGWTYDGGGNAYQQVTEVIDIDNPASSLLLTKPSGAVSHGGGTHYPVGSETYNNILTWIEEGALDN